MKLNFNMMQNFGYSLTDLENQLPWERSIYTQQLIHFLKEEQQKAQRAIRGNNVRR